MFILAHRKDTGEKTFVNMHNVNLFSDGVIYFNGSTEPLYVTETSEEMRAQMPYGGAYI